MGGARPQRTRVRAPHPLPLPYVTPAGTRLTPRRRPSESPHRCSCLRGSRDGDAGGRVQGRSSAMAGFLPRELAEGVLASLPSHGRTQTWSRHCPSEPETQSQTHCGQGPLAGQHGGKPFVTGVLTSCHDELKSFLATLTSKCSWAQSGQASGLLNFARARGGQTPSNFHESPAPLDTQSAHTHRPVARARARGHCRENRISSRHGVADRRDPPSEMA